MRSPTRAGAFERRSSVTTTSCGARCSTSACRRPTPRTAPSRLCACSPVASTPSSPGQRRRSCSRPRCAWPPSSAAPRAAGRPPTTRWTSTRSSRRRRRPRSCSTRCARERRCRRCSRRCPSICGSCSSSSRSRSSPRRRASAQRRRRLDARRRVGKARAPPLGRRRPDRTRTFRSTTSPGTRPTPSASGTEAFCPARPRASTRRRAAPSSGSTRGEARARARTTSMRSTVASTTPSPATPGAAWAAHTSPPWARRRSAQASGATSIFRGTSGSGTSTTTAIGSPRTAAAIPTRASTARTWRRTRAARSRRSSSEASWKRRPAWSLTSGTAATPVAAFHPSRATS